METNVDSRNELSQKNPAFFHLAFHGLEVCVFRITRSEDLGFRSAPVLSTNQTHRRGEASAEIHGVKCLLTDPGGLEHLDLFDQGQQTNQPNSLTFDAIEWLHRAVDLVLSRPHGLEILHRPIGDARNSLILYGDGRLVLFDRICQLK